MGGIREAEIESLKDFSNCVVEETSSPVVRYRLMRGVLGLPPGDPKCDSAYREVLESPLVAELVGEQWSDGSWGRLHSVDTRVKQKFGTTEVGVARAAALGLRADHPVMTKAADRLAEVIKTGNVRDWAEKNPLWPTGVRLFAASTLALIDAHHPAIDPVYDHWVQIAQETFNSGRYDSQAEDNVHLKLSGAPVKGSYLVVHNKYAYCLLSSRPDRLGRPLAERLLRHACSFPGGIKYLEVTAHVPPVDKSGQLECWFRSHELLSRFPGWGRVCGAAVEWLLEKQNPEGWWDLGPRSRMSVILPLTENWRKKNTRRTDWTTRVLLLLARAF
jgi:hypothetical protein